MLSLAVPEQSGRCPFTVAETETSTLALTKSNAPCPTFESLDVMQSVDGGVNILGFASARDPVLKSHSYELHMITS